MSVERKFNRIVTIDASLSERSSHRLSRGESSAAKRLSTVISFRIRKKTSDQRTAKPAARPSVKCHVKSAAIRAPKDSQICRFNVSLEFASMKELNIENLHITVGDQQIVRGLTLRVPRGEVQALNSRRLDLRTASSSV